MIIWGTRMYGWVDGIEGQGMVATRFFHLMFVPLIPLGTVFMVDDDRGAPISLSWKSILVAYLRAGIFWSAVVCWFSVPATIGLTCILALPLTLAYFVMPFFVRTASERRAAEILADLQGQ